MILRRFMKHVSDQNWFAVGLDVLVVITGIFLGMQVTEWNEDRKQAVDQSISLEQIREDLEVSIVFGEAFLKDHTESQGAIEALVRESAAETMMMNTEAFHQNIYHALYDLSRIRFQRKTWQELMNKGQFKSLGDAELRALITRSVSVQDRLMRRAENLDIYTRDIIDPWLTENVEVWKFVRGDFAENANRTGMFNKAPAVEVSSLLKSRQMTNMLAYRYSFIGEDIEVYNELKDAYQALKQKLDKMLNSELEMITESA